MQHLITDEIWAILGPMVEGCRSKRGLEPEMTDPNVLLRQPYWGQTGVPWRDIPAEFGAWNVVYNRHWRWIHSGRLKKLFDPISERDECEDTRWLMIDSTGVRAQQHPAGRGAKRGWRGAGRPPIAGRVHDEVDRRRLR
ncbi:MAG: hypothetical protein BGO49_26195 [Planctomycetales bacterium 71-10]|mgnify:CR=1 FL=1|nr:MAG: hypothetical protein BGO49_26195 [Planctomycetales bacterium 71-10]